jgi:hypothetical protein
MKGSGNPKASDVNVLIPMFEQALNRSLAHLRSSRWLAPFFK